MPRKAFGVRAMTTGERQARRRKQFGDMQDALIQIRDAARTITEARDIAREALARRPTPPPSAAP